MSRLLDMLLIGYQNDEESNNLELIKNLAKEHMIWSKQGLEILHVFRNIENFAEVVPFLINRIADRHNRFSLV